VLFGVPVETERRKALVRAGQQLVVSTDEPETVSPARVISSAIAS
jgi:hypothetical protein